MMVNLPDSSKQTLPKDGGWGGGYLGWGRLFVGLIFKKSWIHDGHGLTFRVRCNFECLAKVALLFAQIPWFETLED
jgi:hypothetical protein